MPSNDRRPPTTRLAPTTQLKSCSSQHSPSFTRWASSWDTAPPPRLVHPSRPAPHAPSASTPSTSVVCDMEGEFSGLPPPRGEATKRRLDVTKPSLRCYDVCKTELKPIAPLCVASTPAPTATSTKVAECDNPKTTKATPTSIITSTIPTPTSPGCPAGKTGSGFMLCADYINACGMMYGGYVIF